MSQPNVYVSVPDYLADFLVHDFGDPSTGIVSFPRGSVPRVILKSLLREAPTGWRQGDTTGMLAIEVPQIKGVRPGALCYLSADGQGALVSACKKLFQATLVVELRDLFAHDVQITDVVYDFMDRHGIDRSERNWETIRQMYSRLRKKSRLMK